MTSGGGAGGSGGSQNSGGSQGSGGTTSSGGVSSGGTTGSGGVTGSGGANTGGTTTKGGTTGTTAKGGATGSGGATDSGGANTGGTTAKGGTTGSGGATGSGGQTQGTGGATGSGGATGTGGGSGTGGATGAGGSSGALNVADIIPALDGFYWEITCSGNVSVSGKNCPLYDNGSTTCNTSTATWATRGTIRNQTVAVKGTAGTPYTINFEVRGVVGTRCYTGGTPSLTTAPSNTGLNNTWYIGGTQANDSIWNTYELHVNSAPASAPTVYYFNGFPANPTYCEIEGTYQVGYTASFKVNGGSNLTLTIHDSNCQGQQNCGSNYSSSTCDSPVKVDLSGMSPAATFTQPPTNVVGTKTYYPQWLYFDVKSVTSP
jgi:hypothetical protein